MVLLLLVTPLSTPAAAQQAHPPRAPVVVSGHAPPPGPAGFRFRDSFPSTGIETDRQIASPDIARDAGPGWSVTGAIVGGIVGAAVGGALGCLANRDDYGVFCGGQSDAKVAVGAVLGAGAGALIGARLPGWLR